MEQAQSPQNLTDNVPLSSSPSASAGSQELPIEDSCGSLSFSPPGPDVSLEDSKIQSAIHQGACRLEGIQPLLSPFAVVNNVPPLVSEGIGVRSIALQHTLASFPPSPDVQQVSPDSSSNASHIVPDVLQSPFGVNLKTSESFLSNDLFLSSSPTNCSFVPNVSNVNASDIGSNGNLKDEARKRGNDLSDSGESTAGAPLTPKALRGPGVASSPFFVLESVEKQTPEEEIICADVNNDHHHVQAPVTDRERSYKLVQSSWSPSIISRESPSITAIPSLSKSPDSQSLVATPFNERSTAKNLSITKLPGMIHQSPINKRPLEPNEEKTVPVPKRMTLASQQKQHKKLASPFRSPLLFRENARDTNTPSSSPSTPSLADAGKPSTPPKSFSHLASTGPHPRTPLASSAKAKSQFKSPLVASTSSSSSSPFRVANTRTIQELERKVQLLKRAVKIKKEDEEEKLEQLVKKWRAVGCEAAWELWKIVHDNDEASDAPYPGTNSKSFTGSFPSGWGCADALGSAQTGSWGWDKPIEQELHEDDAGSVELESPTKLEQELFDNLGKKSCVPRTSMLPPTPRGAYFEQRDVDPDYDRLTEANELDKNETPQAGVQGAGQPKSLGTMLHQLGIAHETLGWVEDEGDFVDA